MALKRAKSFDVCLKNNPVKSDHVTEFMQKLSDNQHAEPAHGPSKSKCWYLPLFCVYHPKKTNSARVVFDSSARFHGVSLNDCYMMMAPSVTRLLVYLVYFSDSRGRLLPLQLMWNKCFTISKCVWIIETICASYGTRTMTFRNL